MDDIMTSVLDQHVSDLFAVYNADCVEFAATLPDNVIDFSVYSPPFAHLFVYSDSERDMGNVKDEAEFKALYAHLVKEMYRATKPGRLTAVHCSDLPRTKSMHGCVGLYDFPADIREVHEAAGWTYHSRITVWKDPVVEMTRTKALGLLYKQLQKDSTRSRQGMPDYILISARRLTTKAKPSPSGRTASGFPSSNGRSGPARSGWTSIRPTC